MCPVISRLSKVSVITTMHWSLSECQTVSVKCDTPVLVPLNLIIFYFLSMYIWFYSCLIMQFMYFYRYDYVFSVYVYVWLPLLRFFRAFSSVVRQMPGQNPQRRGTSRTLPSCCVVLCIFCVVLCIFVLFYVLFVLWRSLYCLCVYVYQTTATGWLANCS